MRVLIVGILLVISRLAAGSTVPVSEGGSIQAAIDAASEGDVITVGPGTFVEDLDFRGKGVTVRGIGPTTIVRGTGTASVVRFSTGETGASVLDSVTVTGGVAPQGGGIFISAASPTIVRCTIMENRAVGQGSGLYIENSTARVVNDLIVCNGNAGGDPHSLQIRNASPSVVNNTIVHGDSNGILVSGAASLPEIRNNIMAYNGSRPPGDDPRGRGICDFGPATVIQYKLFYRNRVAALLTTTGTDYRTIRRGQNDVAEPRLSNNLDGSPRFVRSTADYSLRPTSRALHAGDPDPAFDDLGGGRNTVGHTGGPFAAPSTALPCSGREKEGRA